MRGGLALVVSAALAVLCHSAVAARVQPAGQERIQHKVDTSEAEAVLAVLDTKRSGEGPGEPAWQRVFSSEPYVRSKKREASLNSFVFEVSTDPAIFLYLDPEVTAPKFANTVAHELHHIGYSSVKPAKSGLENLSPGARTAVEWMGAFGEGFAMLAAAGSPDVHPHAVSPEKERARWDHDVKSFGKDLKTLEKFFLDVVEGRLKTEAEINERAFSFFGTQGPWYTVGYKMAVAIEKREGRAKLIACMSDSRRLLATYNRVAAERSKKEKQPLALWSNELLSRIGAVAISGKATP
jgi:hypothetical protein